MRTGGTRPALPASPGGQTGRRTERRSLSTVVAPSSPRTSTAVIRRICRTIVLRMTRRPTGLQTAPASRSTPTEQASGLRLLHLHLYPDHHHRLPTASSQE